MTVTRDQEPEVGTQRSRAGQERPDPEVPARAKPARTYSARYKAGILAEYESLDREGKGALLSREGLYSSLISLWRKQRDRGGLKALAQPTGRPPADPVERENQFLRRRVAKLEGELDKAQRVIEIQGKLSARVPRQASTNRRVRVPLGQTARGAR